MAKLKKNGEEKKSGGKTRDGINQLSRPFKLNKPLLEGYDKIENKNGLINQLISNHLSGFLFKIGGLSVSKKGDLFAIQDTSSGEYWEVSSLDFEMSLRKLF